MPRLLIVNCTHDSLLQSLAALGSRPYDTQFVDSVSRHLPAGQVLETLTLTPVGARWLDVDLRAAVGTDALA